MPRIEIQIGEKQKAFLDHSIAEGRFGTLNEAIAEGVERLRSDAVEEGEKLEHLRLAIRAAEASGKAAPGAFERLRSYLHERADATGL